MQVSTAIGDRSPVIIDATGFDLAGTLSSGQSFRWRMAGPDEWRGIVRESVLSVRQVEGLLEVRFVSDGNWGENRVAGITEYFDLHLQSDYASIRARLVRNERIRRLLEVQSGLHILRQEPFEVLISFIISAFNNILRIERCIDRLARCYGRPLNVSAQLEHAFPAPEALATASETELRACGLGYRAPYVKEAAARVVSLGAGFESFARLPTARLRAELLQFPGIGVKVAECILLFAYHRLEAFPIDVWVRRAMCQLYYRGRRLPDRRLAARASREFGADAGLAQQYLFTAYRARLPSTRSDGARDRM